jgi:hypothetical protein
MRPSRPPWISATDGALPAFHRMTWTADDLFFYGVSCWARTNSTVPPFFPLRMDRLPMGAWRVEQDTGRVLLPDGVGGWRVARAGEVVLFFGPDEGILVHGEETIRHAADLQRAAGKAAKHPAPYLDLHQTGGDPLTDVQIRGLVEAWVAAREADNGGIAYSNASIEVRAVGTFSEHLVIEGRNTAAVDIARHSNLPAELLDATGTGGTLTYQTSRDNDRRTIDYGIGGLMSAISGRLSQNDVHPTVAGWRSTWRSGCAAPCPASPPPRPRHRPQLRRLLLPHSRLPRGRCRLPPRPGRPRSDRPRAAVRAADRRRRSAVPHRRGHPGAVG